MLSIDSKFWSIRCYNGAVVLITQRASGVTRSTSRSAFPSDEALALMSEARFNSICRQQFHGC